MNIFVTGPMDIGKTSVVRKVVEKLKSNNYDCSGFYTISDNNDCLLIVSVNDYERFVLGCEEDKFEDSVEVGRFYFNPDTISKGIELMNDSSDFLVVDELGWLEGRGEGFYPVFDLINEGNFKGSLLSVRLELVEFFSNNINKNLNKKIVEVNESNRNSLSGKIFKDLVKEF